MTLRDRILAFLREHPSSTARTIADALGVPGVSVSSYLSMMFNSHAVDRSRRMPFAYTLLDPLAAGVFPSRSPVPLGKGTRLADEQLVLAALTEGVAGNRKTLLGLLEWTPHRLGQAVDRLHSADLVKTVQGSYVLILHSP